MDSRRTIGAWVEYFHEWQPVLQRARVAFAEHQLQARTRSPSLGSWRPNSSTFSHWTLVPTGCAEVLFLTYGKVNLMVTSRPVMLLRCRRTVSRPTVTRSSSAGSHR